MEIKRYCGKERLLGSERLWRSLARKVGFRGTLEVYGYGVRGKPGVEQRREMYGLQVGLTTFADFSPGLIRVWVPCACAAAEYDHDDLNRRRADPLTAFAHELGHHIQHVKHPGLDEEGVAERYGRRLLRQVGR